MKPPILMVLGILAIILVSGCTQLSPNSNNNSSGTQMTYDSCIANIVANVKMQAGHFGPAKDEPLGATRKDWDGNTWIKTNETGGTSYDENGTAIIQYMWKSPDGHSYASEIVIDTYPGGINYNPDPNKLNLSECNKYLGIVTQSGDITYDTCVADIIAKERERVGHYLKPATEEPIGAIRIDKDGNYWIKSSDGMWYTNSTSTKFKGLAWGPVTIDKLPGGINYNPDPKELNFSECEKYIGTNNTHMEQAFRNIINAEIQSQKAKGVIFSIKELHVLNLAGKTQGFIFLNCSSVNPAKEQEIIGNLARALIAQYPQEYGANNSRHSWVDFHCIYTAGWRMGDGIFSMMM